MAPRRNSRRNFSRRPRRFRNNRRIRNTLNGTRTTPPADPREITRQPWNSLTVFRGFSQTTAGVPFVLTPTLLANYIRDQVGLPSTSSIELRIISIGAWDLSGTAVGIRPFDLFAETSGGSGNPLTVITDQPGRNKWARVGYYFPVAQRNNTLSSSDGTTTISEVEFSAVSSFGSVRFRVLWRPTTSLVPTMFHPVSYTPISNNIPDVVPKSSSVNLEGSH